nr:ABC transporter C family member 3 [Ipomoea batatas]
MLVSLSSLPFSLSYEGDCPLFNPIFLRSISASLHLLLLLLIVLVWMFKKIVNTQDYTKEKAHKNARMLCYKQTISSCLSLSLFNLVLCLLTQFYWYSSGWSEEKILTFSDFLIKAVSWLVISVVLHTQFLNSVENKYPLVLRAWWGCFFALSCYCLVVDIFYHKKNKTLSAQFWVSDLVSTVMGLFFCSVGFSGKKEAVGDLLKEPLLNGGEVKLPSGDETVTPYFSASLFSTLTYSWMNPLISLGTKRILNPEDIPQLAGLDSIRGIFPILRDKLGSSSEGGRKLTTFMLAKALIFTVWKEIMLSAIYILLYKLPAYVEAYLINNLVQFLNGSREFRNEGYLLVSAFLIAKLVESVAETQYFFKVRQAGFRVRAALVAKVYNKGLTLSCQSRQSHTSGEIINFMTVDAERIADFVWYIHDPWIILVQIGLALVILYKNLGGASIVALLSTVIVMLANFPLAKLQERYQEKLMKSKDSRMKATSEVLRNMRILKLQAWEMKFLSKILGIRNTEVGWLRKFGYISALTTFVNWVAPSFVSVATFGAAVLMGVPLESGKVLSSLATFTTLKQPIYKIPDAISMIAQIKVSLDRIASFLSLDDLQPSAIEKLPRGSSDVAIDIVEGNFCWNETSSSPLLKDINVRVYHGMKVAICGTVASGKSSLLSCILGEMPKISGSVKLCGSKAYVPQSPWIQSGTIEENILFGMKMDSEKYDRVLEACSLKKDLEVLPFGDQTVIGERGINLSGGQKQRVQIARALYQDADIYLFDDPFSAVDAHTGTHLFNECILRLLDSKTVIYVTHQVEFLPAADLILVMKDGRISQAGKYNDILKLESEFMELVGAHNEAISATDSFEERIVTVRNESGGMLTTNDAINEEATDGKIDGSVRPKGQLVQEEEREKGRVGFLVYWQYITMAFGGFLVPFILVAQIIFQTLQIGSNYWMTWATPVSEGETPPVGSSTLLLVYVAFAIGSSFCVLVRALLLVTTGFKTATLLFHKMHLCIFRAPMSFFDATPSGRILNRASTDQSVVDLNIPSQIGSFAFTIIDTLGIIAIMSLVSWQVFVFFIPVIAICVYYQRQYLPSARELARLAGVAKAPVIQHFAETLSGATTIRGFDQESRFCDTNMKLIDNYSRPRFHVYGAMQWICFRLNVLSVITFAFTLIFFVSVPVGTIDANFAVLAVTYGINLNSELIWIALCFCIVENSIISVERIIQYTCMSSEPPLVTESNRLDACWPPNGRVEISNLKVRYAPQLPLVLRGITCTFLGGKKTGVVGRTGSGKSTLIQTLFRVVEPADGEIVIDGINISSIGLHDLRARLSIIPQDPTMFEGTIRGNLDPLEEYTDEQIWEALDKCQLGSEVRKKEAGLDSAVTENGENWSVGQRQLVCLGRVLLKKSKILVLDEATASVDTMTDNLIQQTLRQHFSDSTVITIAHRITSVLDSDMVLLLDNGVVAENDTPANLLDNKSSLFAKLVAEYTMRSSSSGLEKLS